MDIIKRNEDERNPGVYVGEEKLKETENLKEESQRIKEEGHREESVRKPHTLEEEKREPDFETFLMEKHADQFVGTKDMLVDDWPDWVTGLDVDTIIDYANEYTKILVIKLEVYMKQIQKELFQLNTTIEDYQRSKEPIPDDHLPKDQCEEIEIDQPECN